MTESVKTELNEQEINICYSGDLAEKKPEEMYIRVGMGGEWNDIKEVKMNYDEENGAYNAVLAINSDTDRINFCFKDNKGEWDNNEGENYTYLIEKEAIEKQAVANELVAKEVIAEEEPITIMQKMLEQTTEEMSKIEDTIQLYSDNDLNERIENSLLVIENSKKSLIEFINGPVDLSKFVDAVAKMLETIKEALSNILTKEYYLGQNPNQPTLAEIMTREIKFGSKHDNTEELI